MKNAPFEKEDVDMLLEKFGYEKQSISIDRGPRKVLAELAQAFIEEALDVGNNHRRQTTLEDIEMAIADKFGEITNKKMERSIEIMQKRAAEINKAAEIN